MLKRFLKFLKHSDEEEIPDFEGSYLDYLLMCAQEGVEYELDMCKEHDPLLLVIAQILRVSMRNVWSVSLRRPLIDQHSPLKRTSPPPTPRRDLPTEELDVEEVELLTEEQELEEQDLIDEVEGDADESGVEHVDSAPAQDAQDVVSVDLDEEVQETTNEIDVQRLREEQDAALEHDLGEDDLPRVDKSEVLQAGRVFLGMLIENDRLPLDLQMGVDETMLARDLLVGYFVGHQNFEAKAQKLLRVVEQKFSEGQFSQARILLQLFQTDRDTRIRNDRNIFYEDMIQRLGIRRRHPISDAFIQEFEAFSPQDDHFMEWLSEQLFVHMNAFVRDEADVDIWERVGAKSSLPGASESLLRFLPPRRWRPVTSDVEAQRVLMRRHVNTDTLANYITNQMRTCYFVLRAVGDTGLETYLDAFFDWTEAQFEFNATLIFPELYRRSMGDIDMMRTIFVDLYQRFFKEEAEAKLEAFTDEDYTRALHNAIALIQSSDPNEVPPGHYDFGGFVFDQLLGMKYPVVEFAFKVHRMT